jgi:hypothetical protein
MIDEAKYEIMRQVKTMQDKAQAHFESERKHILYLLMGNGITPKEFEDYCRDVDKPKTTNN